uniref:Fibrinogen C-terminal domain-containing protein n=1 Tax=Anopheles funestus TaxID=62324 RepID=A0A4Y0BF27_ANOFN
MKFSTFDANYDGSTRNCAAIVHGAWWFSDCAHSNPNGRYGTEHVKMTRFHWAFQFLKTSKMMIRANTD